MKTTKICFVVSYFTEVSIDAVFGGVTLCIMIKLTMGDIYDKICNERFI